MVQRERSDLGHSQELSELRRGVGGDIREVIWVSQVTLGALAFLLRLQEPQEGSQ